MEMMYLAAGALNQAKKRSIDVPRDISLIGFDDIELARIILPELTNAHVPHREKRKS